MNVVKRQQLTAGFQRCGLSYIWRKTEGVGFEMPGTLPQTNSIWLLPALSMCRRRHGENGREQQKHMNKNLKKQIDEGFFSNKCSGC